MGRRLSLVVSFAVLVLLAAFPASSLAATASVGVVEGAQVLFYDADLGEANRVEASGAVGETVTIHDAGAVVTAGVGCASVDEHSVECAANFLSRMVLTLLDLDDTLSASGFAVSRGFRLSADGGAGADVLSSFGRSELLGRGGDDRLSGARSSVGGSGNDVLRGTGQTDHLDGGSGDDSITGGGRWDFISPGSGEDVIDAGAGEHDLLSYSNLRGPVTVNLRTGVATGAGMDTITGVEGVAGSRRGDLLIGDENANRLFGSQGADVIRGGGGADNLYDEGLAAFSRSSDRLYGGPGNDVLRADRGQDLLDGGLGRDWLLAGAGDDFLRSRDGQRDMLRGQQGHDRARVDRGLDSVRSVEKLL